MPIFRFYTVRAIVNTARALDYPVRLSHGGLLVTMPRKDARAFEELAAELHRSYSCEPACFDGVYVGEE